MIRSGRIGRWAARAPAIVAALALAAGVTACGKSAQSHYDAAERFAAEGRMPEAILEYRNAVAKQPQFADAQLKLAERLYEVGNQTRALPEFVKAADLLPKRADVQIRAGSLLLLTRRFEEARARADKAIALAPSNADALVLRANALTGLADLDQALEQMELAVGLDPKAALYSNLGTLRLAAASARKPRPPSARRWRSSRSRSLPTWRSATICGRPGGWPKPKRRSRPGTRRTPRTCWRTA